MSTYFRPNGLDDSLYDFVNGTITNVPFDVILQPSDSDLEYVLSISANINVLPGLSKLSPLYKSSPSSGYTTYHYQRQIIGPGYYQDYMNVKYSNGFFSPLTRQTVNIGYYIFQKSIAIAKADGVIISNGQTISRNKEVEIIYDATESRGYENGSTINISYQVGAGAWTTAVAGIDYTLTGTLGSYFKIKFKKVATFRIENQISGYTSSNHPFPTFNIYNSPRGLVQQNSDNSLFFIAVSDPAPAPGDNPDPVDFPQETIEFPPVEAVVQPSVVITSSPLKTYTNVNVTITPYFNFAPIFWQSGNTLLTKPNSDILEEMIRVCNINLHIQGPNGNDVLPPRQGLGPQEVILPAAGSYIFIYIVTLK